MTLRSVVLAALLVTGIAGSALAQLSVVPYVSGFDTPVGMVQDPTDPSVQYVVEQKGRIRVVRNGVLQPTPLLDYVALGDANPVLFGGERGMLGLAFPPDYAVSGRAYVYFTMKQGSGDSVVARFKRSATNALVLDPNSRVDLEWAPGQRFIQQPPPPDFTNHKGGKILFGPDGYLYIALGDGGSSGDPDNRAQDPNTLLGKILRIDVGVDDSDPKGYRIPPDNPFVDGVPVPALGEIWAFGVRNPWRITFDTPGLGGTGALLIADVGQGSWEEIDYEPAGKGGRNYGWALREGAHDFEPETPPAFTPLVEPIHEYSFGGQAITGGYVYRGTDLGAAFSGRYFFADFVQQRLFSLGLTIDPVTGEAAPVLPGQVTEHTAEVGGSGAFGGVSSIDIDSHGEIYLVSRSQGALLKVILDADNDTLPDGWETQFGLDPASSVGNDGAAGDPDNDGRTNAEELAAGSHPNGIAALARYLAEGSSSAFFETTIGIANPGLQPAAVQLRFLRTGASVITHSFTLEAQRHITVRPDQLTGLQAADFSTVVETNQEVVVERTMTWTRAARFGSHSERAVAAPSTTWYLAEGATHGAFDTFYLLENPSETTAASVEITYLRPAGASPLVKVYTVNANSRLTIPVDGELPELAATDVSASIRVLNGVGIIAERAMYHTSQNTPFNAGHDSAGVTAAATSWFFAEGATGSFFDMYLLLANPGSAPANVTVRYLLPGGAAPVSKEYVIAPTSRRTISVEGELPALADTAVSMVVESDGEVVAERAMYWPADWIEAHNSPGATETGTAWAIAGGEQGGALAAQTYVLIANTSQIEGRARVTVLREGAAPLSHELVLQADSRTNVPIGDIPAFATANDSRFGVLVESLGDTPAQIVVERATYANGVDGTIWAAGSNALASRIR